MRRLYLMAIIFALALVLCACGEDETVAAASAATSFVSPIADKYGIDLTCEEIEPYEAESIDATLYNYIFSSEKYCDLSDDEKIAVLKELDEMNIKSADEYMDLSSSGAKTLERYLRDVSGGSLPVHNGGVFILSGDREYIVDNIGTSITTGERSLLNLEDDLNIVDIDKMEYDGDYVLYVNRDAGEVYCVGRFSYPAVKAKAGNKKSGSGEKCAVCNGTGYVRYYYGSSDLEAALDGEPNYTTGPCTSCGGTGYVN